MAGWGSKYIELLEQGNAVKFRPPGNSMSGKIESDREPFPDRERYRSNKRVDIKQKYLWHEYGDFILRRVRLAQTSTNVA
jgi:hypothetical protein